MRTPIALLTLLAACFSSHGGNRDGAVAPRPDGSPVRLDAGPAPFPGDGGGPHQRDAGPPPPPPPPPARDGSVFPPPPPPPPPPPDLFEHCVTACVHAVECGADTDGEGINGCRRGCAEIPQSDMLCRLLLGAALDCLLALPCADLAGRDPGETRCAPEFVDFQNTCEDRRPGPPPIPVPGP